MENVRYCYIVNTEQPHEGPGSQTCLPASHHMIA